MALKLRWKIALTYFLVTLFASMSVDLVAGTYGYFFPPLINVEAEVYDFITLHRKEMISGLQQHNRFLLEMVLDRRITSLLSELPGQGPQDEDWMFVFYPKLAAVMYSKESGSIIAVSQQTSLSQGITSNLEHSQIDGCSVDELKRIGFPKECASRNHKHFNVYRTNLAELGFDDVELLFFIERLPPFYRYLYNIIGSWSGQSGAVFFLGAFGILYGILISNWFVKRLSKVSAASERWSLANLSARIDDSSSDELGRLSRQLDTMAGSLESLTEKHKDVAVLSERNRIARDLHDAVKQQVFALAMQISTADKKIQAGLPTHDLMRIMKQGIHSIQQELNLLLAELKNSHDDSKLFSEYILEQINGLLQAREGLDLKFTCSPSYRPQGESRMTVIRIIQEAVSNSVRHSGATVIEIVIEVENSNCAISIIDNGIGIEPLAQKKGYGLASMKERSALLKNGSFRLESGPNEGTAIYLTYQLP